MTDENEVGNDEAVEEIDDIVEEKDDDGNDTTDWKALALKNQGIAKRYQTKLQKQKEAEDTDKTEDTKETTKQDTTKKSDELDYGQKAYLAANDIKDPDEVKLVEDIMKDTGKTLEEVLEHKVFKADLEDFREKSKTKRASDATGKSKRASGSARTEVDYWIAKGELPEDRKLRIEVIAARRKKDTNGNPFRT